MKFCKAVLAATAAAIVTPLAAQDAEVAARYGARPSVIDISLSPSGNKLAIVAPDAAHGEVVKVADFSGDATMQTILRNTERSGDISSCDWATEVRLVCELIGSAARNDGLLLGYSRLFSLDDDGSDLKILT